MDLASRIEAELNQAFKNGQKTEVSTLRLVKSALKNAQIAKKGDLTEEEVIKIIKQEIKKRQEAIELYEQGGRPELAKKEEAEIKILKKYLPEQMSEAEILKIIEKVLAENQFSSPADFGKTMGLVMKEVGGGADGAMVSKLLREQLKEE